MVEQVHPTPPYDVLTTFGVAANDATKASTTSSHTNTHSAIQANGKGDTVTLSESAQASQLFRQGNSISQIAAQLGLPPATVDNYLNLSSSQAGTQKTPENSVNTQAGQTSPATASSPFNATSTPVTAATLSTANVS